MNYAPYLRIRERDGGELIGFEGAQGEELKKGIIYKKAALFGTAF